MFTVWLLHHSPKPIVFHQTLSCKRDKTQSISYLFMKVIALGQRTWEKQPGIGISVKFHHASIRTTADTQLNEYSHHQCWEAQTNWQLSQEKRREVMNTYLSVNHWLIRIEKFSSCPISDIFRAHLWKHSGLCREQGKEFYDGQRDIGHSRHLVQFPTWKFLTAWCVAFKRNID